MPPRAAQTGISRRVVEVEPIGPPAVSLSVVVPIFNEARRLIPTLDAIAGWLAERGDRTEIVLVDDGSTDATPGVIARFRQGLREAARPWRVVTHTSNRGKGAAVRSGLDTARGSWVLVSDADLSCPLREHDRLRAHADATGADLVVGSRVAAGARIEARASRRLSGVVFRTWLNVLGLGLVQDTQCGFKLYSRRAVELVRDSGREDGYLFDIEHMLLLRRAGMRVEEVGVQWSHVDAGKVRVVRDGLRMAVGAARLRARFSARGVSRQSSGD